MAGRRGTPLPPLLRSPAPTCELVTPPCLEICVPARFASCVVVCGVYHIIPARLRFLYCVSDVNRVLFCRWFAAVLECLLCLFSEDDPCTAWNTLLNVIFDRSLIISLNLKSVYNRIVNLYLV